MNQVLEKIETRRSVRSYKKEQISKEDLESIVRAGTFAPSGRGLQSPIIVAIQDPSVIAQVSKLNASVLGNDKDPFYGAPTLLVVFADKERVTCVEDGSAVLCNMVNAAHSIGVDSCWIHRAKETFETRDGRFLMANWGIPANYIGIGNVILGYCQGEYPPKKPRNEGRVIWL